MKIENHFRLHQSNIECIYRLSNYEKFMAMGAEHVEAEKPISKEDMLEQELVDKLDDMAYNERHRSRRLKDINANDKFYDKTLEKYHKVKKDYRLKNYNSEKYPHFDEIGRRLEDKEKESGNSLKDYLEYIGRTEKQVEFNKRRDAYIRSGVGVGFDAFISERLGLSDLQDEETLSFLGNLEEAIEQGLNENMSADFDNEDYHERNEAIGSLFADDKTYSDGPHVVENDENAGFNEW